MDVDIWASRVHSAKHLSVVQAHRLNSGTLAANAEQGRLIMTGLFSVQSNKPISLITLLRALMRVTDTRDWIKIVSVSKDLTAADELRAFSLRLLRRRLKLVREKWKVSDRSFGSSTLEKMVESEDESVVNASHVTSVREVECLVRESDV